MSRGKGAWRDIPQAVPEDVYLPSSRAGDERLANALERDVREVTPGDIVLIGFPQDEGVRRNGGRPGANEGPRAIRSVLGRFAAPQGLLSGKRRLVDVGDIPVSSDLRLSQELLGEVVAGVLKAEAFPIILGGGHETAFGHFLGYVKAQIPVLAFNLDAHFDLRPLEDEGGHSGTPFRQMLEHESRLCKGYYCYGIQEAVNSRSLFEFASEYGVKHKPYREENVEGLRHFFEAASREAQESDAQLLVSFDLDAVCQADSPGVSAPQAVGLSAREVVDFAQSATGTPRLGSLDVVECNPFFDRDEQTARLAARYLWEFIKGLCQQ